MASGTSKISRVRFPDEQARRFLPALVIFLIALVLKLLFAFSVRDNPFVTNPILDGSENIRVARLILTSGLLQDDAFFIAPLYPYLLAGYYAIFGFHSFGMVLIQAVLGAAHVAIIFGLAQAVFQNRRVATFAAILTLGYGVYYFYEVLILKETWSVFIYDLALLLFVLSWKKPGTVKLFLVGLLWGVSGLLRENLLMSVPLVGLWFLYAISRKQLKFVMAIAWLVGVVVGVAPATIHNALVAKDFVPISYQGGTVFFTGNHDGATGLPQPLIPGRSNPELERQDAKMIAEQSEGRKLKPHEIFAFWSQQAMDYIVNNPGDWVKLMAHKFCLFHSNWEIPDTIDYHFFREQSGALRLMPVPFWLIFSLAVVGIAASLKNWKEYLLLYILMVSAVFSVVLCFIVSRYRLPVVTYYVLFAALGLEQLWRFVQSRDWKKLIGAIILIVLMAAFSLAQPRKANDLESYNNLGTIYLEKGQYDSALDCFRKILAQGADAFFVHAQMAQAFAGKGDVVRATTEYRTALSMIVNDARSPKEAKAQEFFIVGGELLRMLKASGQKDEETRVREEFNKQYAALGGNVQAQEAAEKMSDAAAEAELGVSLWRQKRLPEAREHLEKAAQLAPSDAQAQNNLGVVLGQLGDLAGAERCFLAAVKADPQFARARFNLALSYADAKKDQEAIDSLDELLRMKYDVDKVHFHYARVLLRAGRVPEAKEHLQQALKLNPAFKEAAALLKKTN